MPLCFSLMPLGEHTQGSFDIHEAVFFLYSSINSHSILFFSVSNPHPKRRWINQSVCLNLELDLIHTNLSLGKTQPLLSSECGHSIDTAKVPMQRAPAKIHHQPGKKLSWVDLHQASTPCQPNLHVNICSNITETAGIFQVSWDLEGVCNNIDVFLVVRQFTNQWPLTQMLSHTSIKVWQFTSKGTELNKAAKSTPWVTAFRASKCELLTMTCHAAKLMTQNNESLENSRKYWTKNK